MKGRAMVGNGNEEGGASKILADILGSSLGAKKKVRAIADALLGGSVEPGVCARAATNADGATRGTVLESFELATRTRPELIGAPLFESLLTYLADPAPRVRWEAARTIANVAAAHPDRSEKAAKALMPNTEHEGTVVRWATAHALAAILRAGHGGDSFAARLQGIAARESDDGVRGVYEKALRRKR